MTRLDSLRALVAKNPNNPLARFGLAIEEAKEGQLAEARANFEAYLERYDDEGNGWQRLADVRRRLGDLSGAREALERGIEAATRFGHPSMADEMRELLEEL